MITIDCHSSFLGEAVYNPAKETLRITIGGHWYYYYGITPQKFARFRHSESRGRYFCNYIKGKYDSVKRKVRS